MRSIEFLKAFHADGPWVLSAIAVDRKGIITRTFGPETEEAARQWIEKYNGERNLYFSVNLPGTSLEKKASREDIDYVPWFHVDLDARTHESLPEELERIKTLLTYERPQDIPEPTFIVFSGNGYWAFWKLAEPIPVKGDIHAAEEAARYNQQLEIVLKGDNCHNIDRIARLPGTWNLPTKPKIAMGRVRTMAEVDGHHEHAVYDLSAFRQAEPSEKPQSQEKIENIDDLTISDRLKVIAVQGHDPDNPKSGDNSRSAWVFDFLCNGLREGIDGRTTRSSRYGSLGPSPSMCPWTT